jgi:two-component system cell cycle sensor histidine kinase/response regulator CckA
MGFPVAEWGYVMTNGPCGAPEVWDDAARGETLDRISGGLAHDLNNLLTVILGRTDLLLRRLHGEAVRGDLSVIRSAAEQASALTRFLGVASARSMVSPAAIDLNATLGSLREKIREKLGPRITLHQTFASDLGPAITDPRHLEGMLLALVERAAKVMPGGGKLLVETRNATLDAEYASRRPVVRGGEYVLLAVSDTGDPLPEELHAHVFDGRAIVPGAEGDLELPMLYGLIKQCGGYVWVYAEPGLGTTFKLYLPRREERNMPSAPRAVETESRIAGSETILLVEDQEAVRTVAREILEDAGYAVLEAEDAGQAVLLAEALGKAPDLLVTDVVLPGSSGRDLADRLRRDGLLGRVIVMSGYTPGALTLHDLMEGSPRFLQKPFTPEALLGTVREALDGPATEGSR